MGKCFPSCSVYLHLWLVSETQFSNHLWEKLDCPETSFLRSSLGAGVVNRMGLDHSGLQACADEIKLAGWLPLWATQFHYVPNLAIVCTFVSCITDPYLPNMYSVNMWGTLKVWHIIANSFSWEKCDLHWWLLVAPSLIPAMTLANRIVCDLSPPPAFLWPSHTFRCFSLNLTVSVPSCCLATWFSRSLTAVHPS